MLLSAKQCQEKVGGGVSVFKWRREKGWENFVLGASKSLLFAGDE